MAYATFDDLKQVEPTIDEYGILNWEEELERSEREINRILKVRWYLTFQSTRPSLGQQEFNPQLLDPEQFTQACVYHALSYHICPKLTKFTPEEDRFNVMMRYYAGRFEHEIDLIIREGVHYDINQDGQVDRDEKGSIDQLRLRR
jgi:hypothetical protein